MSSFSFLFAFDKRRGEKEDEEEDGEASDDVAGADEEGLPVAQVHRPLQDGGLPPGGALQDPALLVDEGRNAGVSAAGDVPSGLDGPVVINSGQSQKLAVGSIVEQ